MGECGEKAPPALRPRRRSRPRGASRGGLGDGCSGAGEDGGPPEWEARGEGQAHNRGCGGAPGVPAVGLPPAPPELDAEPGRPLSVSLPFPPNPTANQAQTPT